MIFPTDYSSIQERIRLIDPLTYSKSRNYIDGSVTYLSPYISRGVISTKQVMEEILSRGLDFWKTEKLLQELAWRDYWQQVWIAKGEEINSDLKRPQPDVNHREMVSAINNANTSIEAIDEKIQELYHSGYMHNHMRMYVASMACNQGKSYWKTPAQWMYYYLLDGDWASNALSWQWVAGSNANKKYIANQENINHYFRSTQKDTFLDIAYEDLAELGCPSELSETESLSLQTLLPKKISIPLLDYELPTLVYNYYNLDPLWRKDEQVNRVMLLEPSVFEKYPVSKKCIDFALDLSKNIPNVQIFVGEFSELKQLNPSGSYIYKEHPLNKSYEGIEDERDWMFGVKGYYASFFAFWKKCKKEPCR